MGVVAERVYKPDSIEDLAAFLSQLDKDEPITWIGGGTNILVRDGGVYVPSEALAERAVAADVGEADSSAGAEIEGSDLTPRQRTVLSLLERGMSNKAIARELGIGEITVKAHVSAILRKLGVENRLQAIVAVRERKRKR